MEKNMSVYKKKGWAQMSPKEQHRRPIDLWVLDKVRRGKMSLKAASKEAGVTPKSVIAHTNAFKKVGRRWIAKKYDRLEKYDEIFVDGNIKPIITNDSRQRSRINRYKNAVGQLWDWGNKEPLLKLKGLIVKDVNGYIFEFDTEPESVVEIMKRFEGPDHGEPYPI